MKIVIVIALIAVLGALASAGFFMLKRRDGEAAPTTPDKRMARSLALRVALSVAVFLFILLSWKMGWISPRGIPH